MRREGLPYPARERVHGHVVPRPGVVLREGRRRVLVRGARHRGAELVPGAHHGLHAVLRARAPP
eukprot:7786580-Lingulodinium_polyedra.AAC.1